VFREYSTHPKNTDPKANPNLSPEGLGQGGIFVSPKKEYKVKTRDLVFAKNSKLDSWLVTKLNLGG
jgi:hypothetical protein